jgi:DNA-binding transcriptional LysR family regulator
MLPSLSVPKPRSLIGPRRYDTAAMDIELRHLRYFVAVAEEASFTAGARRAHVAQQVLSTQVRQLEDALGVKLFNRTRHGVTLTPAGDAFLDGARETLGTLERTAAAARNISNAVVSRLTIGLSVAAGGAEPTRLLAEFGRLSPQVEVKLRTYELTAPAAGLLDHSTDVAFVRPSVASPVVVTRAIGTEPRVFVLPVGHPLAGRGRIDLSESAGLPWVAAELADDGCDPAAWRDDWLVNRHPGDKEPIFGAVARTIDEWREHVVAGRGISLCPASAETHYARPGLAFVPSRGAPPAELCLAWRADEDKPAVAHFVEVVSTAARGAPEP